MNKIIEVTVSPSGETKVETQGFTSNACRDASKFLEDALGTRNSELLKAEFYQAQATYNSVQTGNQ